MASNLRPISGQMFILGVLFAIITLSDSVSAVSDPELASMLTVLRARGYGLFANAITASDAYYEVLDGDSFTFFAPTSSTLFALDMTAAAPEYISTLRYHVVPRRLSLRDLQRFTTGVNLTTLMPNQEVFVQIRPDSGMITVEGVDVVIPGLFYSQNLAVHGLGGILRFRSHIRPYFGVSPLFPTPEASNGLPPPTETHDSQGSAPPDLGDQTANSGNSIMLQPSDNLPPPSDLVGNRGSPSPGIGDESTNFGNSVTSPPSETPFYLPPPNDFVANQGSLPPETSEDRGSQTLDFDNSPAPSILQPQIPPDHRSIVPPVVSPVPESATMIDQAPPVGSPLQISSSIGLPPSISVTLPPVGSPLRAEGSPAPPPSIGGFPVSGEGPVRIPAFPKMPPVESPPRADGSPAPQPSIGGFPLSGEGPVRIPAFPKMPPVESPPRADGSPAPPPRADGSPAPPPSIGGYPVSGEGPVRIPAFPKMPPVGSPPRADGSPASPPSIGGFPMSGEVPVRIPAFPKITEDSSTSQPWKRQLRAAAVTSGIIAGETPLTWLSDHTDAVDCPVSVTPLGHVTFQQYASSGPTCARLKASL